MGLDLNNPQNTTRCFWHNSPDNKTFYCLASFAMDRIRNVPIFWFPTLITQSQLGSDKYWAVSRPSLRVIGWLLSRPRSLLPGSGPRNWIWWSQLCMDRNCLSLSWRVETFSDWFRDPGPALYTMCGLTIEDNEWKMLSLAGHTRPRHIWNISRLIASLLSKRSNPPLSPLCGAF